MASRFHFSTPIKPYPSLALGAFKVIPQELARAYCVFAAGGVQPYPLALKGVVNEADQTLEQLHMEVEKRMDATRHSAGRPDCRVGQMIQSGFGRAGH